MFVVSSAETRHLSFASERMMWLGQAGLGFLRHGLAWALPGGGLDAVLRVTMSGESVCPDELTSDHPVSETGCCTFVQLSETKSPMNVP